MSSTAHANSIAFVRIILIAFLLVSILSSCSLKETRPPNIIIITLDTLRGDHLSCYGYHRNTSPHLDAFVRAATLYKRAVATSPWTVPTHASLFTGKFPFEHGARTFKVHKPINNANPLSIEELTLAEVLREEGYVTGAFVANQVYLSRRWQMDQGFDTYEMVEGYAPAVNTRVYDWLDELGEKPFLLFINYIDTHRPYNSAWQKDCPTPRTVQDGGKALDDLYAAVMPAEGPVPKDLAQKVIDQYDTSIANLDREVGLLLERLVAMNLYENTIIVITSDHGEFFGEHHLVEHSKDVYEPVLSIPLIIKNPHQIEGREINTLTTSTDVPGLILSQLSGDIASLHLAKFPDVPGNHVVIAENYYTRTKDLFHPKWGERFNRIRTAIYDWPYKYIHSSDGKHELYNLDVDPEESNNLVAQESDIAMRLAEEVTRFQDSRIRATERIDQAPMTKEEIDKLRALGYIGD